MIPTFPKFKKVEESDQETIESYTLRFPPYSDFNFFSLWSWDTNEKRMVSELHGNLVVRFTDYATHTPFLSYLGTTQQEETASTLMQFAQSEGISPILRLVPKDSVENLSPSFTVEEDEGNFDYIYLVPELATLRGSRFKAQRQLSNRFTRRYPQARFEILSFSDASNLSAIATLLHSWKSNKKSKDKEHEIPNEKTAIDRILKAAHADSLMVGGVFFGESMIGFSINEILSNLYGIVHFEKADITYTGVYDFLIQNTARHLATKDVLLWNWEQDLGIENLRRLKMNYCPAGFFKKYRVSR